MSERRRPDWARMVLIALGVIVLVLGLGFWGRQRAAEKQRLAVSVSGMTYGGDPARGRLIARANGCGGCHDIPGVEGARGAIGPSLEAFGGRRYIAGRLNNEPRNLIVWLRDPHSIDPQTAMPDVGLSEHQARDIAAYLYTLR